MEQVNFIYALLDPNKPGVYKYENYLFEFEPFYIGKSKDGSVYDRVSQHTEFVKIRGVDLTNNNYKFNIIKSILNSGKEPIQMRVEENLDLDYAFSLEKYLIIIIGRRINNEGPLVNISSGGDGGDTFSNNPRKEEIRIKRRNHMLGSGNNMYGMKLEEYPSHKAKLNNCHWNTGRKVSDETRKKFSERSKGKRNSRSIGIYKYDTEGNFIEEYSFIKECVIANNLVYSTFCDNMKKGYHKIGEFVYKKKI